MAPVFLPYPTLELQSRLYRVIKEIKPERNKNKEIKHTRVIAIYMSSVCIMLVAAYQSQLNKKNLYCSGLASICMTFTPKFMQSCQTLLAL